MASSSTSETKEEENIFSFEVKAGVLRGLAGLEDPTLNPFRTGVLAVCKGGFEVTVFNETNVEEPVFGLLSLRAGGLTNFCCRKSMIKLLEFKGDISEFLSNTKDDQLVKVYCPDEEDGVSLELTGRLYYLFARQRETRIPFGRSLPPITKFPELEYAFEKEIPRSTFEPMLDRILEQHPSRRPTSVSLDIDTNVAFKLDNNVQVTVEEKKVARFEFPYYESLKKTIVLADPCTLWLVKSPVQGVVLRFDMKESGVFMYFKFAKEFVLCEDLPIIGSYKPIY